MGPAESNHSLQQPIRRFYCGLIKKNNEQEQHSLLQAHATIIAICSQGKHDFGN
jgi:hypothetical protein